MAKIVQRRRGTTAEHATFTGALGELTVDSTKDTVVVHDGAAAGGYPLLRQDLSNLPAGTIDNADINASAGIADTKLATISTAGKVSNSATTATNANTASAIVARDGSGNFTAGTITAALTGAASSNVLKAGDTMTGALAVPLASASTPSLTFSGDPNTGIYSPGADQVAVATNGVGRLFINSVGLVQANGNLAGGRDLNQFIRLNGDASANYVQGVSSAGNAKPLVIETDTNSSSLQLRTVTENPILFTTNSTEKVRITSAGLVGIGTSAPWSASTVFGQGTAGDVTSSRQLSVGPASTYNVSLGYYQTGAAQPFAGVVQALDNNVGTRLLLNPSGGNVGIGTSSPTTGVLVVRGNDANQLALEPNDSATYGRLDIGHFTNGAFIGTAAGTDPAASNLLRFGTSATERARIDSSGRLLVGTSTSRTLTGYDSGLQLEGVTNYQSSSISLTHNRVDNGGPEFRFCKSRGGTTGATTLVNSGDILGRLYFYGTDGSAAIEAVRITAEVDGTPGANDMPGRLVFSTTADGAAGPTERLRITSAGVLQIADAGNITVGTTTGTKIGTAPTQKLGFYNATPVVQPAAVANATDAASVITQLNDLLAKLRTLGIIAT